jgi:serine/threonine-protein kinase
MPEWIGKTVGKVRIENEIAWGGMAEVYLGTHLTLDRLVAVKVMHHFVESEPELQSRFEREAKVVAGLRHPNIVQIYDYDTVDGHPYIVMEYLKGSSLASYLRELNKRHERLPPAQIARLLMTIAAALDYAHERGVVHRDIKPGNIILHTHKNEIVMDQPITEQAEPVLTDFGLVRIAQSITQTDSGAVSGTPAYMSPEQAQGIRVDRRSDIYSLGVVLYEMIAGRIPFEGDTSWTVIFQHINAPPPPIAGIQPSVQQVIDRVLAKNPDQRYQTARAFAADYMDAIGLVAEANTIPISMSGAPSTALPPQTPAGRLSQPFEAASPLRTSTQGTVGPAPQPVEKAPAPAWARFAPFAIAAILILAAAAFLLPRLTSSNQPTESPPTLAQPTTAATEVHATEHPTTDPNVVPPVDSAIPVGLLRFQDGTAPADQLTISTDGMQLPPEGSQYEAWLIEDDGEGRISVGTIEFGAEDKGALTYVDNEGENLISRYSGVEITIEPNDSNPNSSNNVAFSARLPQDGLTHVRHLLFSFGGTPNQVGFIRGLDATTQLLADLSAEMLAAFESGNEAEISLQAESMLNLIAGSHSDDYKDWNGDGSIGDPSDGYGLLSNDDQLGYIQGSFTHADLARTSAAATQNMLTHGEHVKISTDNISKWTGQLRVQLIEIIENPSHPEREGLIRQAVALANQIRSGVDVNGNERVEPIQDEGGALTAYEHAYYMADISILPAESATPVP